MAYWDLYSLAFDADFYARTEAAAAEQNYPDPPVWADTHRWELAAAPTFAEKYASAIAGGVPNPGRDEAVIPDADIRAAVQTIGAGQ
jgi:hypothetical protein